MISQRQARHNAHLAFQKAIIDGTDPELAVRAAPGWAVLQAKADRVAAEIAAMRDAHERLHAPADLPLLPLTEVGAQWVPDGNGGWAQKHILRPDIAQWVQDTIGAKIDHGRDI